MPLLTASNARVFDIELSTVAINVAKPVDIGGIHGRFEPELVRKSLIVDAGGSGGRRAFELRIRRSGVRVTPGAP